MSNEQNGFENEQPTDTFQFEGGYETAIGPPEMSGIKRFIGIFASPVKVFENVYHYPKFGMPFVVLVVCGLLTALVAKQYYGIIQEEIMRITAEVYGADFAKYLNNMMFSVGGFAEIGAVLGMSVGVVIGTPIVNFIYAVVALVIGKGFLKGETSLKKLFSMFMHVSIITSVSTVLVYGVGVLTGSITNAFSPAIFMKADMMNPMYMFMNTVSIFYIWNIVLMFLGLKTVIKSETNKNVVAAIVIVVVLTGVGLLMTLGNSNPVKGYENLFQMYQSGQLG